MAAYAQYKTGDQEAVGRRMQWPGHHIDSKIAAHRTGSRPSSAHHHSKSIQQRQDVPKLPMTPPTMASSGKGRSSMASGHTDHGTGRQSPKRRDDGWDEQQSLLNILSQPSPHRLWSAEGFTGRPELDATVTQDQMLPGTLSWTSPRNHIGVHPESLLYNRDPEQLAADVIGLSKKYAALATEHKLQKVQINKLSSSLSRERAEAAELDEVAEMMGMASPRNRALSPRSRASSHPDSPGRAFRSPCRPSSRPTSARLAREQSGASMPEWVFTDLQQRLNAAQQLLDQRSMACTQGQGQGQGHLAGTWPRARPRSPARKGSRPVSSHISLDPNSRLADAFAIYGVPRGITQYMARKWSQPSTRGSVVNLASPMQGRSSLMSHQQLQEKVAAVKKASHVILLEAMQLRAHFPPAVSAQEHEALGPHLDALINLLHSHSIQVQQELSMLPGFNSNQVSPGSTFGQTPTYSSSLAAPSYPPRQASREASPQQGYPSLPSDNEENSSFIAADNDSADEEAAAAAADDTCESAIEAPVEAAEFGDLSAQEEAEQSTAVTGTAEVSAAAEMEVEKASKDSASLSDRVSRIQVEFPESQLAEPKPTAAEAVAETPQAKIEAPEATTKASKDGVQSAPGGGGILDEYMRRMHFSKETPLPPPALALTPPQGAPAHVAMPRRWTKTNSYPDGSKGSQKAWESGRGGSFKGPATEAPLDVMTYDDSSSGQVAPVTVESAEAAFNDACGDSFQRREDVVHPAMHIGKSDEASPPELQLLDSVSQEQPAEVSCDDFIAEEEPMKAPARQLSTADSVVSQVASASSSGSVLSQIAESAHEQPDDDLEETLQFEEALTPSQASAAEQEADSADGGYADEFEPDEPAAEATAAALPPQTIYDNPLGDDELAGEEERQSTQHFGSGPSSSQLDKSHAPHVATQLAVSDNGAVKLHCDLEVEDRSADYKRDSTGDHMAPPAASTHVPHVNTRLNAAGGDAVKVQWSLDVSRDEPEEDAEDVEDDVQGKGRSTKMPSTPFPKRSIFSASVHMADDVELEEEAEEEDGDQGNGRSTKMPSTPFPRRSIFRASVSIADDVEPEEDAEEEDDDQGKGRFTKVPSTPFPRRSIFSASGNMADDVDIFSMTQPGDDSASEQDESAAAAASDFGASLHRVSSDIRQDSMAESGMQLTPSYRQTQGRSLQQAADNEQPFAASWRPEPANEAAQEAGSVTLAPKATSQTPSRQSSLASGRGQAASGDVQPSLSTPGTTVPAKQASLSPNNAAAAAVPATLPNHASLPVQFSLDKLSTGSLSRQPSNVTAPASAVSSRRSSFSARIERETSQLLGVRQGSNAASLAGAHQPSQDVSRTASLSTNPTLSPELSSQSLAPEARSSQESSRMVSKRSSFSKPAELRQQSSQVSRQSSGGKGLAAAAAPSAAASRAASRQPSLTDPAALSQQSSQVGRQLSMVSAAAASLAASRVASRQASLTHPIALSRQGSQVSRQPSTATLAAAAAPSSAASRVASRQASMTQDPLVLSIQASQISRQPSTVSTAGASRIEASPAASRVVSRQASWTQPIALSRQASQISRQPSTASVAAAATPSEATSRVATRQPSFSRPASASRQSSQRQSGSSGLVTSQTVSRVSSRQQSLVARGHPVRDVHDSPVPDQLVSQSPSVSHSMSSQPRRSNSLEALHWQMSVPRKATAVAAVAPAAAVRKLSQDNEGRSIRPTESRQPSNASIEVDLMLKSILPHNSGIPEMEGVKGSEQASDDMLSDDNSSSHGEHHFESSYGYDGRLAAEKHAYLHSQHGMDDSVF